ncbi:MAG: AMP-binding protein, partial [Pyrinomonadaceae bacterium]|nr:AMP-binding protein [Pyrinomonadaceae bacterium]
MLKNAENEIRRKVERIPLYPDEPRTIAELFKYAAEKHSRSNALNFKKDGKWQAISTAEMLSRIEKIAAGLRAIGLQPGDRAAILAANSPEWTLVDAGCQFAGVVDVPIYTTLVA